MSLSRRAVLLGVPAAAAAVAAPTVLADAAPALLGTAAADTTPAAVQTARQSPIDIPTNRAVYSPHLPAIRVHYPRSLDFSVRYLSTGEPGGCGIKNIGESIQADFTPGQAWITLGGVRYDLVNFHFHLRSEHRLNGRDFALEQHFVHQGTNGRSLVLGVFLNADGRGGTPQDQVLTDVPVECGPSVRVRGVDLAGNLPRDLSTFRYDGSLTDPPFSEPVDWLVLSSLRQIKRSSYANLQARFPDGNARELQPLNGRTIRYRPQHI